MRPTATLLLLMAAALPLGGKWKVKEKRYDPVPVTGLAANFSPIPRTAAPPFGRLSAGGEIRKDVWSADVACAPGPAGCATTPWRISSLRRADHDAIALSFHERNQGTREAR